VSTREFDVTLRNRSPTYVQAGPFCQYEGQQMLVPLGGYFSDEDGNDVFLTSATSGIHNTFIDLDQMELYGTPTAFDQD